MWVPVVPFVFYPSHTQKTSYSGKEKCPPELPQVANCSENYIWAEKSVSTCEWWDESVCTRRPPTAAPNCWPLKVQASNGGKTEGNLGEEKSFSGHLSQKNQPPPTVWNLDSARLDFLSEIVYHHLACLNWWTSSFVFSCVIHDIMLLVWSHVC